jgi:hypothetical protein
MKAATLTIDALCELIDAGDDSSLPILADALEEAGDARAAGLRDRNYCPGELWSRTVPARSSGGDGSPTQAALAATKCRRPYSPSCRGPVRSNPARTHGRIRGSVTPPAPLLTSPWPRH